MLGERHKMNKCKPRADVFYPETSLKLVETNVIFTVQALNTTIDACNMFNYLFKKLLLQCSAQTRSKWGHLSHYPGKKETFDL